MSKEIADYNRLLADGLRYDGESNTRFQFSVMSKRFGKAYIDYLIASYKAKDELSNVDFCLLNGEVPEKFLVKLCDQ